MLKHVSVFGLCVTTVAVLSAPAWSAQQLAVPRSADVQAKAFTFDGKEALAGWAITGDVTIDVAKGREGGSSSLKVGPGSKALLKLRERDESGKVEVWVYDDGTASEDVKAGRLGPRWGLVQSDGKVLAVGILYANYLGGDKGYTATACDGRDWFNQLFWLGVNRAPAGWHRWTFDFDVEAGLQVFHNDREVTAVDPAKTGLAGFNAVAIWGDAGRGDEQSIWVDDLFIALGGPVKMAPVPGAADPYSAQALAADQTVHRAVAIYTGDVAQARRPAAARERLAVRHHLDLRATGPRRPVRQRRLVRRGAGDREGHRPQAALRQGDRRKRIGRRR